MVVRITELLYHSLCLHQRWVLFIMNPMTKQPVGCIEVLRPFFREFGDDPRVQLMGGIGSVALQDPDSRLSVRDEVIDLASGRDMPLLRDNGTRRDVDVLVTTADEAFRERVQARLEEIVDGQLEVSVFGLLGPEKLRRSLARPLGLTACMTFLADRYEHPSDAQGGFVKALFPFMVPLDEATLRPWRLEIDDQTSVHIPHPTASLGNYISRSISGVREKDAAKIGAMSEQLQQRSGLIEWLYEGPGASQLELARLIHSTGVGVGPLNDVLPRPVAALSRQELMEHEGWMMAEAPQWQQRMALGLFALKARTLRGVESSALVRQLWQQFAERSVGTAIIENRS